MSKIGRPRKRVTLQCGGCETDVERRPSEVPKSGRVFCSPACRNRVGSKPRRGEDRTCARASCTVTFYARASSTRRFCSSGCRDEETRRPVTRTCPPPCGKTFELPPSEPDIYCSRACYDATRRRAAVGRRKTTSDGYVVVFMPGHSEAQGSGWTPEHRMLIADLLGRPLLPGENVHHRNGQRHDNRAANLELWVTCQPSGKRPEDLTAFARTMLGRYGDAEERLRYGAAAV